MITLNKPLFPNTTISLYSYVDGGMDDYGETKVSYKYRETVEADVQVMSPKDTQREFGKTLEDTYKIYLPYEVEIHDTDRIKLNDTNTCCEILGTPEKWNHLISYNKIIVQKYRNQKDLEDT